MIDEIREHFEKEYPREGCGIIAVVKGKKKWFPCENVAEDFEDFIISSEDWLNVRTKADIIAVVHSHPDETNQPSEHDVKHCNALGIPYYIFSYPDMDLNIVEPKKRFYPLVGREYEFGVQDCFEAMRDWLLKQKIEIPARDPFEDNWWEKDLNYFSEENISRWGFKPVDTPQKNDLLIFQVSESVPDHCGVYLGNDVFFHHAINRLSDRKSVV